MVDLSDEEDGYAPTVADTTSECSHNETAAMAIRDESDALRLYEVDVTTNSASTRSVHEFGLVSNKERALEKAKRE